MNKTNFFRASAEDFKKIPGSPVAYWLSVRVKDAFSKYRTLADIAKPRQGLATSDNNRFLKLWHEVSRIRIGMGCKSHEAARVSGCRWFPCQKGGSYRKWYGNQEYVVNWENDGKELLAYATRLYKSPTRTIKNIPFYFKEGMSWSTISSGAFSMRYSPWGFISETKGAVCFAEEKSDLLWLLGFTNTSLVNQFLSAISPTLDYHEGPVGRLPVPWTLSAQDLIKPIVEKCVGLCKADWDAYETSWDFAVNPLVALCDSLRPLRSLCQHPQGGGEVRSGGARGVPALPGNGSRGARTLPELYAQLREKWAKDCEEMRRLEIENNRIFIEAYGLQDELTPEVPWNEITLTCNPWYRYGVKCEDGLRPLTQRTQSTQSDTKNPVEKFPCNSALEDRLRSDTVKELVSYAVGCMMGRYSLEKPGLILADQGSTIKDYYDKITSGGADPQTSLRSFANSAFFVSAPAGSQNPVNPVNPVEKVGGALGDRALPNGGDGTRRPTIFEPDDDGIIPILDNDWFEDDIVTRFKAFIKVAFGEEHFFENMAWIEEALGKDIRSYFTKDFYKDHLQRYQNRPIYWLFQSPKGAFRALVYMHRYKPDMVGGVLGYLRSLQTKVDNQLDVAMRVGADESKSASERVRANKDAVKYAKAKKELDEYEKNVLYPLSTERIEIDLDDGVKVNYRKFGIALKKVAALEG